MVRSLQILLLMALMHSVAMGYRSARVCLSDGNTPLELADPCVPWVYRDIMVGTHLTIIVDSNEGGSWGYGELSIWGTDRDYGVLAGRDCNEETLECPGSLLPAAGDDANAYELCGDDVWGVSFWINQSAVAGDWFIVDYNATSIGNCQVAFYDWDVNDVEPLCEMSFTHVPSRDFNEDSIVNFSDFAVVGSYWGTINCTDPNSCGKVDFDGDQTIGISDLGAFVEYWLERTD
jgi:hypothetical protein